MKTNDAILSQTANARADFIHSPERLFPPVAESCELTVRCRRIDYSASVIARAVEDAEAHLLNLNVTADHAEAGMIDVDLRISHRNAGSVSRSLERYGYEVVAVREGFDPDFELMRQRIDELMSQIEV